MNRQQRFSSLVLAVGILFALSISLPGQQKSGVEGVVRDYDGNPIVAAVVEAKSDRGGKVSQATTDENGSYLLDDLLPGSYTLHLILRGQEVFKLRGVSVRSGEVEEVDLDLQAELERQKKEGKLSAEQLKQLEEMQEQRKRAGSMEASFKQGLEYMKQNMYDEAITEFEAAAEFDPTQFAIYANLGRAYAAANQPDKGVEAYQKAIELKQEEEDQSILAPVYNNLGQLYLKKGDIEGARQAFETAAELSPEDAGAFYYNLGVTFYNANQMAAAIEPLRKATELDPKRADAFYLLGLCLLNTMGTKMVGGEAVPMIKPGTRESFERYLALAPNGKFAAQAKANLQVIEAMAPAK